MNSYEPLFTFRLPNKKVAPVVVKIVKMSYVSVIDRVKIAIIYSASKKNKNSLISV